MNTAPHCPALLEFRIDTAFAVPRGPDAAEHVREAMAVITEKIIAQVPAESLPGEGYLYRETSSPSPLGTPSADADAAEDAAMMAAIQGVLAHGPGQRVQLTMAQEDGMLILTAGQTAVRRRALNPSRRSLAQTILVLRAFQACLQLPPPFQALVDLGWRGVTLPGEEQPR